MMISIALCDDEKKYLDYYSKILKNMIKDHQIQFELVTFNNGDSLLFYLENDPLRFQIFILDVMMPSISGIDLAKKIKKINPNARIIFLTSTKDFVFDAFDVLPVNYILKSSDDKKLKNVVIDLITKIDEHIISDNFVYHTKKQVISIPFSKIVYFEVYHRIITIHVLNQPNFEFYSSLKSLEKLIDPNRFVRIYRSYILNMQYIKRLNYNELELKDGTVLPISRMFFNKVKEKFSIFINKNL